MDAYHPLQLNAEPLIRQGVIEQATLTPTDLLHVNSQMEAWSVDAARQAMEYACGLYAKNPVVFVEETLDLIVAGMVEEAIVFLARQMGKSLLPGYVDGSWGRWLVKEAISGNNPYLKVNIFSRYAIIGIGAPAEIFINRVAQMLGASFILPDHAPVANADSATVP